MALTESQIRSNFTTLKNSINTSKPTGGSIVTYAKPSDDGTINIQGVSNKIIQIADTTWTTDGTNSAMQGNQTQPNLWPRNRSLVRLKNCINVIVTSAYGTTKAKLDGGYANGGAPDGYNDLETIPNSGTPAKKMEAQHAFEIEDCDRVEIRHFDIKNCRGDFFYIRRSDNVFIHDNLAQKNGRQGIAFVSATRCLVEDNTWFNVPRAGIDFENNSASESNEDIIIYNNTIGHHHLNLLANDGAGDLDTVYFVGNSGVWRGNDGNFVMQIIANGSGELRKNYYIYDNDFSTKMWGAGGGHTEKGHIQLGQSNGGEVKEVYVFDNTVKSQDFVGVNPDSIHIIEIYAYHSGSGTPQVPLNQVNRWNNTMIDGIDGIC